VRDARPWNHNIHYWPVVLRAAPTPCERALDVGCGEGLLTRALRARAGHVTGIDRDEASIAAARRGDCAGLDFVAGDFLTHPFAPGSFDLVASVAALHHMDSGAALGRMRDLLRPGGVLVVVGLARSRYPRDLPRELLAVVADHAIKLRRTHWESTAPTIWPPPETYAEVRVAATRVLPGARMRRRLLWRYTLVWTKPAV
jgi:SAM-dependent methyltransferase